MLRSPSQDERESYLLTDIASAANAGLTVEQILNGPSTADLPGPPHNAGTLTEGLCAKGLQLAPHEILMLETAEKAGSIPKVLLILANQRAKRATQTREIRRRLAYPVFLLCFASLVGILSSVALGQGFTALGIVIAIILGAATAVTLLVRQTIRNPNQGLLPAIRTLVLALGELPYLQSMHGLYGAGVTIHQAHSLALTTSPITSVRHQLIQAEDAMKKGSTLSEALHQCTALHVETRQMIASAEVAGELEQALGRAVERRQTAIDLRTQTLLTASVVAAQILVYGFTAYVILSFWLNYYSGLGALR